MAKRSRRQFTEEQKRSILKQVLVDKAAVSDVCDKHEIGVGQFYDWQRKLFEGTLADQRMGRADSERKQLERKVEHLSQRVAQKDEVIAEIMQEHVQLKKGPSRNWVVE